MPRYFVCPDTSVVNDQFFDEFGYLRCGFNGSSSFEELSESDLIDMFGSSGSGQGLENLLFTMQLSSEEHLLLMASIALYFATCWAFNAIGKQINPR